MTWLTMALVGVGSYAFRVIPLFVLPRMAPSPRVDRTIRHAVAAALTALVATSVSQRASTGDLVPTLIAVGCGLVPAVRGASLFRVVLVGGVAYAAARGLTATVL